MVVSIYVNRLQIYSPCESEVSADFMRDLQDLPFILFEPGRSSFLWALSGRVWIAEVFSFVCSVWVVVVIVEDEVSLCIPG